MDKELIADFLEKEYHMTIVDLRKEVGDHLVDEFLEYMETKDARDIPKEVNDFIFDNDPYTRKRRANLRRGTL